MAVFLQVAILVAVGIGLAVFVVWLERRTGIPGLTAVLVGISGILLAITGLASGRRLMPVFLALLGIWWLYEGIGPVVTHIWKRRS